MKSLSKTHFNESYKITEVLIKFTLQIDKTFIKKKTFKCAMEGHPRFGVFT